VTVLSTDLPTDIFTELGEFPTEGGQPATEEPEGIPSAMVSAWESMYPSGR
jgi:hypothetical protein